LPWDFECFSLERPVYPFEPAHLDLPEHVVQLSQPKTLSTSLRRRASLLNNLIRSKTQGLFPQPVKPLRCIAPLFPQPIKPASAHAPQPESPSHSDAHNVPD
jgi:hypothetical protein